MKKMFAMFSILLCCLCCAACSSGYSSIEEAEADGARLGECITIDGVNVSGMSPAEAFEAVETAHTEALKALYYTVSAGEDSLDISGSLLPVAFNTREVILEALLLKKYWPAANGARQLHTSMTADSGELKAALEQQSASLQYAPENAGANYDKAKGGFRYTEHRDGRSIDFDDLTSQISALITGSSGGSVTAKSSPILPEYTTDMVKADTQLISEFSTSFAGGTYGKANRVFNICKAADMIDGVTLAPGEEFDMNAAIGDRNKDNGWKTATAIKEGTYVQEYGGGVCQVSTTLYNALLMADMHIVERHHHSWPLGYVEIGRDATISTGGPDLRFENTSGAALFIRSETDEKQKRITVKLYGRPLADGVSIELSSKKVKTLDDLGTEVEEDASLKPGEQQIVRKARQGSVAITYKTYYSAEGAKLGTQEVTRDTYRSIKGLIKIAPAAAATGAEGGE